MPFATRKLGSSDLEVPIVCLGTMTWGEQNTEEEAFAQMDMALERGCTFWDTAELYPVPPGPKVGLTEEYIGRWFASRGCRDKITIATKIAGPCGPLGDLMASNRTDPKTPLEEVHSNKFDAKAIKAACEGSLRRLQTTYIDLYQLHWPERYAPKFGDRIYKQEMEHPNFTAWEETVQAMGDLIKEGKIKHWGLSNESAHGVTMFCETAKRLGVPKPITIQNDFSLLDRCFEEETAEACSPLFGNVSLLAYGPLAGGTLSGKYLDGKKPEKSRHVVYEVFQRRYHAPLSMEATAEYAALAKSKGLSPTQLALAWCASRWYMGSVIIGATTLEQLKENFDAFDITLDEETLKAIDEIHQRRRNPNHHV